MQQTQQNKPALKRTLGAFHLWGIAVGLVISEYFGWSYGWAQAGTLGFMVTSLLVATMYTAFIFSFTELTTSIPHAGGPFAYAYRAFWSGWRLHNRVCDPGGVVFAPRYRHGDRAYLNVQFPAIDPQMGGGRSLSALYGSQPGGRRYCRHLRAAGHPAGHLRTAGVYGSRQPRL